MKRYVDGYVLPVPKKNIAAYKKLAMKMGKLWMKHGALQYMECVGEDLKSAKKWGCVPFPVMMKTKPGETVLYSFVIYKSRAHRDRVNAKVMKDPAIQDASEDKVPFNPKRMVVGGFETLVNL